MEHLKYRLQNFWTFPDFGPYFILHLILFNLRLEQTSQSEWSEAARNLVLLMASLSFCGHTQLKPSSSTSPSTFLFQMENFQMPEAENNGSCLPILFGSRGVVSPAHCWIVNPWLVHYHFVALPILGNSNEQVLDMNSPPMKCPRAA